MKKTQAEKLSSGPIGFEESSKPISGPTGPEKSIDSVELLRPPVAKHTEDAIEAVDSIPLEAIDKRMLLTMYKEKAYESREFQGKIEELNVEISNSSRKIGVAQERLSQITGMGVVFTILIAIAGIMAGYIAYLPDSSTKTLLLYLVIGIFIVCIGYHFWNATKQKNI